MNMLDLFKKLFFCWAFCACVSAVSGQDVPSSGAPEASDGLFNARRLVVAPLVILAGIIIEIVAIMKKPRK